MHYDLIALPNFSLSWVFHRRVVRPGNELFVPIYMYLNHYHFVTSTLKFKMYMCMQTSL